MSPSDQNKAEGMGPGEKPREGATPISDAHFKTGGRSYWLDDYRFSCAMERDLAQTRLERDSARNVLARAIEHERLANMSATEWEEAAQSAKRELAEQIALAHKLAVDALRGPQSATPALRTGLPDAWLEIDHDGHVMEACVEKDLTSPFKWVPLYRAAPDKTASGKGQG